MGSVVLISYLVILSIALFWGAVDSLASFLSLTLLLVIGAVAFFLMGKFAKG